jgi:phage protein U
MSTDTKKNHHAGDLDLSNLTSLDGIILPDSIGGWLDLRSLTAIPEGLKLPDSIGGWLDLRSLTAIPEGLKKKYGKQIIQ